MNNDRVKDRKKYRQMKGRIKASADSYFFGNQPPENKDRVWNAVGRIREGHGDIDTDPEHDLERVESYSDIRKDLQDNREDGR